MTDTLTEPLPPIRAAAKSACVETDTFCVECGYNLHTQPVTRDERLGIFVCRCPECGRFHPAGTGVTATKVWLSRFATALLLFWVLIVLAVVVLIAIGFGGLQVGHLETFTYRKLVTSDGREAQWKQVTLKNGGTTYSVVAKGTTQPVPQWKMVYTLVPPADDEDDATNPFRYQNRSRRDRVLWLQFAVISGAAAALGLVAGILMVVFLWHWKKRRYVLGTLLPVAAAGFVIGVYFFNEEYEPVLSYAVRVTLGYAAWQAAWMGIGALLGRPIARGILRTIIPPNPRQHFNFLWHADGRKPPPAKPIVATA